MDVNKSTIMMSDSLKGMVPGLDDSELEQFSDAFIVSALELLTGDGKLEVVVANLHGMSHEGSCIKMDLRTKLEDAYLVMTGYMTGECTQCQAVQLHLAEKFVRLQDNFKLLNPKIIDVDSSRKMCTLAVDLLKA